MGKGESRKELGNRLFMNFLHRKSKYNFWNQSESEVPLPYSKFFHLCSFVFFLHLWLNSFFDSVYFKDMFTN
jgi:hypothetical protein